MSTATSGRAREYKVKDALIAHGWELIARSAASKGPADLIMASEEYGLALIQVGTANKRLGPADRTRLLHAAWLCSALPIVATVNRGHINYALVHDGTPSDWEPWTPTQEGGTNGTD